MNYKEAIDYINSPKYSGMKLGLDNMREIMAALGNPQSELKFIHIAGTNGKGSVASYLSHILTKAGLKTGLFTSPFLEKFNERIKINNQEIPDEALSLVTSKVKEQVEASNRKPTEFELITAIAFQYFYKEQCDIVVLEVGLGGRLDSTNIIESPLVSVITKVSYDHQAFLGNTLAEIAGEKAGIIKENSNVLLYPQEKEAEDVIYRVASEKNSTVFKPKFDALTTISASLDTQVFHYEMYNNLKITLLGKHQLKNAVMAIEAVHLLRDAGLSINDTQLREGLEETKWPGRFEIIHQQPIVVIDGAHNIDSVQALVDNLTKNFKNRRIVGIFGVLKDKDVDQIITKVARVFDMFITVTPDTPRALEAEELATKIQEKNLVVVPSNSYEEAVQLAIEASEEDDIICAFGSLYYIGAIRRIMKAK